jgi:hypothetical protein
MSPDHAAVPLELFSAAGIEAHLGAEVLALPPGHPYLRSPIQMTTGVAPRLRDFVTADELARLQQEAEKELQDPDRWGTTFTVIQSWGRRDL